MPQIPSLPIDEPIALPKASPGAFGSVGETVSGLGQETEQLALGNQAFERHLIESQRYLKAKQAEIAFERRRNQVYDDLAKTVTPEEAQAVYDHSKGELDSVLTPFESDRVLSRQLGIYRQQQDVEIQHTVNARKATLIQHGDDAANNVLFDTSSREAINNTIGGGSAQASRDQLEAKLNASVYIMGTMLPEQRDEILRKWDTAVQSGVVEANSNSPNADVRRQTIAQLGGGPGNMDLSALDKGEINRLRTRAIDIDHNLTEKERVQSINSGLGIVHDTLQKYGNNFDLAFKAFDDPKFLTENGIVTPDGKPNYVLAEELKADINRQREYHDRVQKDKDESILEKYAPMVDGNQMTIPQIDQLMTKEGASSRAVATLKTQWYRNERENRTEARFAASEARAARQEKRQELEDRSAQTSLQLWQRIDQGQTLDLTTEVYEQVGKGNLTTQQANTLVQGYKKSKQSVDFANGLAVIDSSTLDVATKAKLHDQFTKAVHEQNTKPEQMVTTAQKLVNDASKGATTGFIQSLFNRIGQGYTGGKPAPTGEQEKKNASGDTVVLRDGKWVLKQ